MKKPVVFITGIAGFVGSYLSRELFNNGYILFGSVYKDDLPENVASLKDIATLVKLDILNQKKCETVIKKIKPDYIFHLAAFSSVGQSFHTERLTYKLNIDGTLNVLQAAKQIKSLKKFVFISSSDCYGVITPKNKTITEDQPLKPQSPYAISKATGEYICQLYYRRFGLPAVIARSFNHSGPGQNENFVIPSFARQIVLIEKNKQSPVIKVGNLSTKRDLSDVRDVVAGYRLLAEKGQPGRVYHFCSGRAVSIKTVLEQMLKLSPKKIVIRIDKGKYRKNDIPVLRGSNKRAIKELGYKSRYQLKITLSDTLNYWREKVL